MNETFVNNIFQNGDFDSLAFEAWNHQFQTNKVYRHWCNAISKTLPPKNLSTIPFLPIGFFKGHKVISGDFTPSVTFKSSGTTGESISHHLVKDANLYTTSFIKGFELPYGKTEDWCILALLPGYLERTDSSLVFMVNELINRSTHPQSGFYLYDHIGLEKSLIIQEKNKQKTLLIGVTYALLDFTENHPIPLSHTIVMETGGMKGKRKEITRNEVHKILSSRFKTTSIHSEYGMTELLSQCYSQGNGRFTPPPWVKFFIREEDDPLSVQNTGRGALNIIDLANIHSCCFIATDDLGFVFPDGSFEVLGRIDSSDVRGCSLMTI